MDYRQSHLNKSTDYDENLQAGGLDTYMLERENEILTEILPKLVSKYNLKRHLDFACGTGRITNVFEKIMHETVGIDISESMVGVAKTKCKKAKFIVKDITSEDVEIEAFDVISSFRFFGNAQDELRLSILKKLNMLLKNDGLLIINNHRNPSSLLCRISGMFGNKDDADWTCGKMTQQLTDNGFIIIRKIAIGTWLVRHRIINDRIYNSYFGRLMDKFFNLPFFACISPDMIIIAQKNNQS